MEGLIRERRLLKELYELGVAYHRVGWLSQGLIRDFLALQRLSSKHAQGAWQQERHVNCLSQPEQKPYFLGGGAHSSLPGAQRRPSVQVTFESFCQLSASSVSLVWILTVLRFVFGGINSLGSDITLMSLIILCSCNVSSFTRGGVVTLFSVIFSGVGSTDGWTAALNFRNAEKVAIKLYNINVLMKMILRKHWSFNSLHFSHLSHSPN